MIYAHAGLHVYSSTLIKFKIISLDTRLKVQSLHELRQKEFLDDISFRDFLHFHSNESETSR